MYNTGGIYTEYLWKRNDKDNVMKSDHIMLLLARIECLYPS